jgi:hypothetical protein
LKQVEGKLSCYKDAVSCGCIHSIAHSYSLQTTFTMASPIQKIAIVGVTGTIGTYLTQALLAKNRFSITAITRTDSKAKIPSDVEVARVDYNDHDSLTEALKGHDALIITTSVFAPKETSAKLIKAAAAAGVPWVLPNEFGMSSTDETARDTIGMSFWACHLGSVSPAASGTSIRCPTVSYMASTSISAALRSSMMGHKN